MVSGGGDEPSSVDGANGTAGPVGPERRAQAHTGGRIRLVTILPEFGSSRPGRDLGGTAEAVRQRIGSTWRAVAQRRHVPVIILIGLYVVWFSYLSLRLYFGYGDPPFDLAIFNQGLWLLSHFHAPFVTVMGRNLFGDHTSLILLLVAPFYRLVPEPQGILVLQTMAFAAAAIPIYLLSNRLIKSTTIATLLTGAFLLNPALQQGNLDQFHPEAFQVLIISVAILAAVESRTTLLVVMVGLALLVKEDAAALIIPLGAWVAWRRSPRLGVWIMGVAAAWAIIANEVIIRLFLGATSFYSGRIPFGGPKGVITTLVRHPGQFFSYLWSGGRVFYLWQLGVMVGWGFLLSPEIAGIGLLVIFENVLSNDGYMHQIVYQYSLTLVPVLFLGTAFAISRQKSARMRSVVTGFVVVGALWSSIVWGLAPFSNNHVQGSWYPNSAFGRGVAYVERGLPPDAAVAAWYPLVSHLDQRTQVYVWPTPFSAQNWGLGTNIGARLPVASQVQYLVLPVPLASDQNPDVFAKISSFYTLVRSRNGIGLYRRTGS
jgi:uncharacterized membrane protein